MGLIRGGGTDDGRVHQEDGVMADLEDVLMADLEGVLV